MKSKTNKPIADALDEFAEANVSQETQDKLNLARRNALSALDSENNHSSFKLSQWLLPAGALSMAASVALVFFVTRNNPVPIDENLPLVNDDLLVLSEELPLIEDLQFYEWMLSQET